ncbi:anthranilate phosphoribosyltransferase [Candidatus Epulonipiscioides gigas]|nr:anthranilate phosphoribosyltransferase [Epulopiscium sp. SCG-C07WGA-EpuloA2]
MILVIDNYDSFTYNLVQSIGKYNSNIIVKRNDEITIEEVIRLNPSHIILSPGPGRPKDAGICEELLLAVNDDFKASILGVCLGHQAICEAFGGEVTFAQELMHGKSSTIDIDNDNKLFTNLPLELKVGRYHSLIGTALPDCLYVIGTSDKNEIMAIKHKDYEIYGVQFHPESILTEEGETIISNFLNIRCDAEISPRSYTKESQIIEQIEAGKNLDDVQAKYIMNVIMNGQLSPIMIENFLRALRKKGETPEEITAFVNVLRDKAIKVSTNIDVIDIVGTGGDGANTFNISTTVAFVVAACGVPVAKHGNRSVSSKSGAADVLEALGADINIVENADKMLQETNMAFMFAPLFHSSMRHVADVRKKMGVRTVFNLLGPLLNPAFAPLQLMGVYDKNLVEPLAQVLMNLGVKRAIVVHGSDGLDEATLTGITHVCEINNGVLESYSLEPTNFGFDICDMSSLIGGNATENATITRNILNGNEKGPKRDIVLLNTGLALHVALGVNIADGINMAMDAINNGRALKKLEEFVCVSQMVAKEEHKEYF